jgi:ABC-type multidrug transport system ATPase subunit
MIVFEEVSKFYGEILGVNRVNLQIAPGITSLVGPNGSGKTTLMNLMTGLLKPTSGRISVLGTSPDETGGVLSKNSVTVRSSIHFRAARPPASLSNSTCAFTVTRSRTCAR